MIFITMKLVEMVQLPEIQWATVKLVGMALEDEIELSMKANLAVAEMAQEHQIQGSLQAVYKSYKLG